MAGEHFLYNRPRFPAQLNMAHHLTRGLVGCWVLNENSPNSMRAWDSSLYQNHGTVTGAKGRWQGRSFNGVDEKIDCGAGASLVLTTEATVEVWIKFTSVGINQLIAGKFNVWDGYSLWVSDTGKVGFFIETENGLQYALETIAPATATWIHYAGTYSNTAGKVLLYKNGVQIVTADRVGTITTTTNNYLLGQTPSYNWLDAVVGENRVYNRGLISADIRELYLHPYDMFLR